MSNESYTGRARSRKTPASVRRVEILARLFIYAGGIGTMLAVSLILLFLLSVVAPLFTSGGFEDRRAYPDGSGGSGGSAGPGGPGDAPIIAMAADEYRLMSWSLRRDGSLRLFNLADGSLIEERKLPGEQPPTAWAVAPEGRRIVLGYADGTIRFGEIGFDVGFLDRERAPGALRGLEQGQVGRHETMLAQLTPEGQLRTVRLALRFEEPIRAVREEITCIDSSVLPSDARAVAMLTAGGTLGIYTTLGLENMMTGEMEYEVSKLRLPYEPPPGRGPPAHLKLDGTGTLLFLVWSDGFTIRYDARSEEKARVAETFRAVGEGAQVTAARFLIGKTTLLVGSSRGVVRAWFPTRPDTPGTVDGIVTVAAHELEGPAGAAVTVITPSVRSRYAAAGYSDGSARLFLVTSGELVGEVVTEPGQPVVAAGLTPKEDGFVARTGKALYSWRFESGHPDAGFRAFFGKVWYESYPEPRHVWQSTGGSDDFEPKLGLVPLIFGTLKATLYSMLIAVPVALLAAVYTSEFMKPSVRAPVKSVIEMMASLPSVVLGFIAAMVIAPFVQGVVPATLTALVTVPLAALLGARLWQLLPQRLSNRWAGFQRLGFVLLSLAFGVLIAALLGPVVESVHFGGDLKLWLDGGGGATAGSWAFLLLPAGLLVTAALLARFANPWVHRFSTTWSRERCALFDLGRWGAFLAGGLVVAWLSGAALASLGFDPRGSVVGTYAQRNALIVGFVMGFAIVPIVYTLAEDALSSVPSQLREGSLASGATPWQTAVRIIVPTAMSGIFSAMMVGLGRAVGETMIVLMAAGNTPILEWNAFNGFRTLSANIAVELPEAVRGSTHYRTLFLAGLVLFAMTFVINTLAEAVRRRFRARYSEQL